MPDRSGLLHTSMENANPSRSDRRRQILEAAERLFAKAGYRGTTMEDVAREVGFTQPALYRYFSSKRELFLAALSLRQDDIRDRYQQALAGPSPALEKLRSLARTTVELANENPDMGRLRLQAIAEADELDIRDEVRETVDALLRGHEALFERAREEGSVHAGVDAGAAASGLTGMAILMYASIALDLPMAKPDAALAMADRFLECFESSSSLAQRG
ncbi:MAG: TetR/AcrR family transcriptional regulator [Myxococcota bacterium]